MIWYWWNENIQSCLYPYVFIEVYISPRGSSNICYSTLYGFFSMAAFTWSFASAPDVHTIDRINVRIINLEPLIFVWFLILNQLFEFILALFFCCPMYICVYASNGWFPILKNIFPYTFENIFAVLLLSLALLHSIHSIFLRFWHFSKHVCGLKSHR